MRELGDPPDTAPILGPAIRPTAPAAQDPTKTFELGNWQSTLPEGLAEAPTPMEIVDNSFMSSELLLGHIAAFRQEMLANAGLPLDAPIVTFYPDSFSMVWIPTPRDEECD